MVLERLSGSDAHGRILLQHLGEKLARRGGCASPTELDELEAIGDERWVTHLRWVGGGPWPGMKCG